MTVRNMRRPLFALLAQALVADANAGAQDSCETLMRCRLLPAEAILKIDDTRFLSVHAYYIGEEGNIFPSNDRLLISHSQSSPEVAPTHRILTRFDGFAAHFSRSKIQITGRILYRLVYHLGANGRAYRYFAVTPDRFAPLEFIEGGTFYSNLRDVQDFADGGIVARSSLSHLLPTGGSVTETQYRLLEQGIVKEGQQISFFPATPTKTVSETGKPLDCPDANYMPDQGKRLMWQGHADCFSAGLVRIVLNDKIGFADRTGNIHIQPVYDWISPFNPEDEISVFCHECKINDHQDDWSVSGTNWGIINMSGQEIVPPEHSLENILDAYQEYREKQDS